MKWQVLQRRQPLTFMRLEEPQASHISLEGRGSAAGAARTWRTSCLGSAACWAAKEGEDVGEGVLEVRGGKDVRGLKDLCEEGGGPF